MTIIRTIGEQATGAVHLMTAHKAKGLEFDHVYVVGAVDTAWGERVRLPSRNISYPANLPLAPAGGTYDERLRLFFVAMTRAKATLSISYSTTNTLAKSTLPASFLTGTELEATEQKAESSIETKEALALLDWQRYVTHEPSAEMTELLTPQLERYKLSSTHLNNFIDITRGGPQYFLLNNLLHFPQEKAPNAAYGTAIHATLQRAHTHLSATGERRPVEDILADFEKSLREQHLTLEDFTQYLQRGVDALQAYLAEKYTTFTPTQKTELSFAGQGAVIGDAKLSGNLDLIDIDTETKTVVVTDYKTGKASRDWKGKTEFEKIKLHKYRQQLMFYQLLIEHSRDYANYTFSEGRLQFVEPTREGEILALEASFTNDELEYFKQLIGAVWQSITTLDLPETGEYEQTLKGIQQFEQDIIDKHT